MGEATKIEWTATHHADGTVTPGYTFNHVIGCQRVAPGCQKCYAEAFANRYGKAKWGPQGTRVKTSDANWRKPLKWNREAEAAGERRRVFCASLADVFEDWQGPIHDHHGDRLVVNGSGTVFHVMENWQPCYQERLMTLDDVRRELFTLIDATPHLDWLLLTKRPENIRRMWPHFVVCRKCGVDSSHRMMKYCGDGSDKDNEHRWEPSPRPNVWLGTSISDQETADRNVPLLLECRDLAPVLFLSAEPLLGPIDLGRLKIEHGYELDAFTGRTRGTFTRDIYDLGGSLRWVIVGGESGPKARSCRPEWIRSIVRQCKDASVPCFVKQLGARVVGLDRCWRCGSYDLGAVDGGPPLCNECDATCDRLKDSKGSDMSEWPEDLRVREFSQAERSVSA